MGGWEDGGEEGEAREELFVDWMGEEEGVLAEEVGGVEGGEVGGEEEEIGEDARGWVLKEDSGRGVDEVDGVLGGGEEGEEVGEVGGKLGF